MKKINVTQQQRDNQLEARDVMWPSVPEANVDKGLSSWGYFSRQGPPTCGTIACFGGWVEAWPPFREQLGLDYRSTPGWSRLRSLFSSGEGKHDDAIFNSRRGHPADDGFEGTDHALVTNRLNWIIDNTVVERVKTRL